MSAKPVHLEHVLARTEQVAPRLEEMRTDELKQAARFWFGTTAANKFRKAECVQAMTGLFRDPKRLAEGVRSLPEKERQILAVCKRYGGSVSGPLLLSEVLTRGLADKTKDRGAIYGRRRAADPVSDLCAKLVLVPQHGDYYHYGYFYSEYRLQYPDVAAPAGVLGLVEPAAPLPWAPSAPAAPPRAVSARSAGEVVLDLWTTAQALGQIGTWKTNRGGSLSKSVQNRLHKLFLPSEPDLPAPPDPEALFYEILRGMGAVQVEGDEGRIDLAAVELHLRNTAAVQARHWVRAWMQARLWQDGIGAVPDRDREENPVRIEPAKLRTARELIVWALCRAAHGTGDWLDLETFLADLWTATGQETIDFFWGNYSWDPEFQRARGKNAISADAARRLAYWLDDEGTWAANAIMGTLARLALVERGGGTGATGRPCFRLTPLGAAVFGAPELAATEPDLESKFLTVQPNHEVVVYLNVADAGAVWPLARMARRVSSAAGVVQTFALTRESVYQAQESGLEVDEIRRFLLEHSRTGLPDNVAHSLAEWGRRREALVLRTGVALGAWPPGQADRPPVASKGRRIGDQFTLLPRGASRGVKGLLVRDNENRPIPSWQVDEDGRVEVGKDADAVALARLGQFADPDGRGWKITAASVRRAHGRGVSADQILGWLHDHLKNELPAVVEAAIRNWCGPTNVFLGDLAMLQVRQPQACATIRSSRRFRPLLLGHVPPDWFIVRPEKRAELEQLLTELGFSLGGSYQLTPAAEADKIAAGSRPARSGRRSRKGREA